MDLLRPPRQAQLPMGCEFLRGGSLAAAWPHPKGTAVGPMSIILPHHSSRQEFNDYDDSVPGKNNAVQSALCEHHEKQLVKISA
ncbi:hypothetical protein NDU88_002722 [Pleurodeles waltl]|uniref:Uncharacterized protein n=1 Tax=Pleurodeles waltl TaxID=8319 RepID=A0AAV7UCB9_PLEWA|nr:hypothetical protein NDU88_002722 [Pleurodeles waltl]